MSGKVIGWAFEQGRQRSLPPTQRYVLVAYGDNASEAEAKCWPDKSEIMEKTGYCQATVYRAIKELEAEGLLIFGKDEQGRDCVHLAVPWFSQREKDDSQKEKNNSQREKRSNKGTVKEPTTTPPTVPPKSDGAREDSSPRASGESKVGTGAARPDDWDDWFGHHRATTGHDQIRGSKAAKAQFATRRAEGFSVEELKLATVGCHSDPWLRERHLNVPETILRVSNVTRYIELGRAQVGSIEPALDLAKIVEGLPELLAGWPAVCERLRTSVSPETYELWLAPLRPFGAEGETAYLGGPEDICAWVERRYSSLTLQALGPTYSRVRFISQEETSDAN